MSTSLEDIGVYNARVSDTWRNGHEDTGFELTMASKENGVPDVPIDGHGEMGFGDDAAAREAKYPAGNSSAVGAVSNFVNTIVGAGIVGLPFALAQVCCVANIASVWENAYLFLGRRRPAVKLWREQQQAVFGCAPGDALAPLRGAAHAQATRGRRQ